MRTRGAARIAGSDITGQSADLIEDRPMRLFKKKVFYLGAIHDKRCLDKEMSSWAPEVAAAVRRAAVALETEAALADLAGKRP